MGLKTVSIEESHLLKKSISIYSNVFMNRKEKKKKTRRRVTKIQIMVCIHDRIMGNIYFFLLCILLYFPNSQVEIKNQNMYFMD